MSDMNGVSGALPSIERDLEEEEEEEEDLSSSLLPIDAHTPEDRIKTVRFNEGQSPRYERDDEDEDEDEEDEDQEEDEDEEEELDSGPSPGPSRPTAASPNSSTSTVHTAIPSNGCAPAYDCPLLTKLTALNPLPHPLSMHFAHLNCFQLTHPPTTASTTLIGLKQHAQAVCLLLSVLQPTANRNVWPNVPADPQFPSQFDFLSDLNEPYTGLLPDGTVRKKSHDKPLVGLSNTLESGHRGIGNIELCTRAELMFHSNTLLTRLDHLYRSTGGILSIPPPPPLPEPNEPSHTPTSLVRNSILAQWLGFTRALTLRLASLEKETAALREVMGHEALVASVRGKQSREKTNNGEGCGEREIMFPQDRYVLAGLSEGLWNRLHEELTVREGEDREDREHEREEREQGRGVQGRGWGDFHAPAAEDGDAGETKVVAWIETMSRLYRIRGHDDTIFVIPAFGLHPGAPAVHRVERTPLVQTVPERRGAVDGDSTLEGATAWEREVAARTKAREARMLELQSTVDELRRELETERTERRRLVAEAELKGRRAAGLGDVGGRVHPLNGEGRGKQRER